MIDSCIDILYGEVSKSLQITREQYIATLVGWDIQPIVIDAKQAGVMMIQGHEIHVVLDPTHTKLHGRRIIKKCIDENIDRHGFLTTISFKDPSSVSFIERIGFRKTGEDETFYSFRIDQKFRRSKECHQ